MIAAKRARLDEIVGYLREEKEEEPEGEELGESDTGNILLSFFFIIVIVLITLHYPCTFILSPLFLDDSDEEERRPLTKEEEDIDILCSWMEVGGQPALPEEKAQGLLTEVRKPSCSPFCFDLLLISLMILYV